MWAWLRQSIVAGVLFFLVANAPIWAWLWWTRRRLRMERRQRDVQYQLWAMEHQIWEERRTPEEIARDQEAQAVAAAVRREARQRLGLAEDRGDS